MILRVFTNFLNEKRVVMYISIDIVLIIQVNVDCYTLCMTIAYNSSKSYKPRSAISYQFARTRSFIFIFYFYRFASIECIFLVISYLFLSLLQQFLLSLQQVLLQLIPMWLHKLYGTKANLLIGLREKKGSKKDLIIDPANKKRGR